MKIFCFHPYWPVSLVLIWVPGKVMLSQQGYSGSVLVFINSVYFNASTNHHFHCKWIFLLYPARCRSWPACSYFTMVMYPRCYVYLSFRWFSNLNSVFVFIQLISCWKKLKTIGISDKSLLWKWNESVVNKNSGASLINKCSSLNIS